MPAIDVSTLATPPRSCVKQSVPSRLANWIMVRSMFCLVDITCILLKLLSVLISNSRREVVRHTIWSGRVDELNDCVSGPAMGISKVWANHTEACSHRCSRTTTQKSARLDDRGWTSECSPKPKRLSLLLRSGHATCFPCLSASASFDHVPGIQQIIGY